MMTTMIRRATAADVASLTALCLRSKAVWGYDAAFIAACRAELTLTDADLRDTSVAVALRDGAIVAMVQVAVKAGVGDLMKLFVDPQSLRRGLGNTVFAWAADEARRLGATHLAIEADPEAAPFYRRMGATEIGTAPSGSIPGRRLPLLRLDLTKRRVSTEQQARTADGCRGQRE